MRPASATDLPALQELARRTIDSRYRPFLGDESVEGFIGSGASDDHIESHFRQGHVHCMTAAGRIVGLAILEGPTIDLIMIDVDRQREGLGRVLLTEAEKMLFAEYDEIRLESFTSNHAAIAFYEACGWSVKGPLESAGPERVELVRHR
ncbi:hypothetical protein DB35_09215 [Streptomyces abyssalis]|uniref:N-acetyltransferase domain-containing protein n=1 Tax=Streptomyces abyssalis TaxID=933944 RepID=A0A1E7JTK9_9ACTN|nr:hypothetical protein AN215_03600 [Streptomyces abyssalis]OEU94367.1 hypothetical protein DB35_09215 [Streptomyces abyssalis]